MSNFIDKCKCSVNKALDNTFFQNIANIIPVSYTHLDVYKRQG